MKKYASRTLSRALFLLLLMLTVANGSPALATGPGGVLGKKNTPSLDAAYGNGPPGAAALILAGAPTIPYNKGAPPG